MIANQASSVYREGEINLPKKGRKGFVVQY